MFHRRFSKPMVHNIVISSIVKNTLTILELNNALFQNVVGE
jgi:hypothetical protein